MGDCITLHYGKERKEHYWYFTGTSDKYLRGGGQPLHVGPHVDDDEDGFVRAELAEHGGDLQIVLLHLLCENAGGSSGRKKDKTWC